MSTPQPIEIRMAHLEGAYEQLDKRLGDLAAVMREGFARVDDRLSSIETRFEARFEAIDCKFTSTTWRMTSLILATWSTTILAILLKH